MTRNHLLFALAVVLGAALSGCASEKATEEKKSTQIAYPPEPEEPRYYFERSITKSSDVDDEGAENSLTRALAGKKRKVAGFAKPYSIAVHHGRVYVGDSARRTVMAFDIPGKRFFQIGLEEDDNGQGRLAKPLGLDVDAAGNVYVLDATLKTINVYDADGDFLRNFGNASQLYKPAGLGVTPDGARVYAVDIGGSSSDEHKITVFNGVTGELISTLGKRGAGLGEFNLPRDVTIAPDGSIYVVDGGNFRVQKFDKEGKYISKFGALGRQSGQFSRPKEADVDPSGNVYVVDTAFGNFQIFNPDGQLLMAIGERSNSDGPGLYSLPSGIAVDDDGRVYVVDQFFRRVDIFRPAGLPEDGGWIGKFNPNKNDTESGAEQVVTDSKTGSDNVEQPIEPSQAVPASK